MTPASTSPAKNSFGPQLSNGPRDSAVTVPGRPPNQIEHIVSNAHLFGTIGSLWGKVSPTALSTKAGCQGSRAAAEKAKTQSSGASTSPGACSVAGAELNTNVSAHQTAASFLSLKCQRGAANKNRRAIR